MRGQARCSNVAKFVARLHAGEATGALLCEESRVGGVRMRRPVN